jgi:3-hydroxyisobutyrate dehydrogenase-like beta-hydroxyacid dehydrogenase
MKKIAVIGLGIMGHGIADNFLKNDYEVFVWNRNKDKATDLVNKGAKLVDSPNEAAHHADMVFEVTANDESSREIWLGYNGILSTPFTYPPKFLITCATLSVSWVEELAQKAKQTNIEFFDMPMTGSRVGAESGQLTLFVGGNEDALSQIKPDLQAIAKDVKYFGSVGSGTKYKLVLNTLQAIHMIGFGEAMKLAKAAGLDESKTAEALKERPGGVITNIAADSYFQPPVAVTFSVDWITKDLNYATKMAGDLKHALLNDVLKIYKKSVEDGKGPEDWTEVNKPND